MSSSSGEPKLPIVIVGGGISGLTLAYRLHQAGRDFRLFEASERFGGNIETTSHDGFLYDLGPDSFLRTKPQAASLCEELGLKEELISPSEGGTRVLVAHKGQLQPMPEGMSLGVPKKIGPFLNSNSVVFTLKTEVPKISLGMRSGVNWILLNPTSNVLASNLAVMVLATPGTPSMRE